MFRDYLRREPMIIGTPKKMIKFGHPGRPRKTVDTKSLKWMDLDDVVQLNSTIYWNVAQNMVYMPLRSFKARIIFKEFDTQFVIVEPIERVRCMFYPPKGDAYESELGPPSHAGPSRFNTLDDVRTLGLSTADTDRLWVNLESIHMNARRTQLKELPK